MSFKGYFNKHLLFEHGIIVERENDQEFRVAIYSEIEKIKEKMKMDNSYSIDVDDYRVMIILDPDSPTGFFTFTRNKPKIPVVVLNVDGICEDLYKRQKFIDIIDKMSDVLFHELTHLMNYRVVAKPGEEYENLKNIKGKYNNREEFNAYYQQTASLFERMLPNLIKSDNTFESVYGDNVQQFISKFWNKLNEINNEIVDSIAQSKVYKRKWLKRIYQLYYELMDTYNRAKGITVDS